MRWLSVAGSLPKGDVRGMDGSGELGGVLTVDGVSELELEEEAWVSEVTNEVLS